MVQNSPILKLKQRIFSEKITVKFSLFIDYIKIYE